MRKLILTLLAALMLLSAFQAEACAAGVADPSINGTGPDCDLYPGNEAWLFVDAVACGEQDTLHYIWYGADTASMSSMIADIYAPDSSSYHAPERPGTRYYCCGVYAERDGMQSDIVYSRIMSVTYWDEPEYAVDIEIISDPYKMAYTVGEYLDMNGLCVRVYTNKGYMDLYNGEGLDYYGDALQNTGDRKINLTYSDAYGTHTVQLLITVKAHTHSYGEWMVTTQPTCTEEGIKLRECDCGREERESVPAAGHSWDEGKTVKEATATQDGEKLFTCTVCGAERKESIPATGEKTVKTSAKETPTVRAPVPEKVIPLEKESTGFPLWAVVTAAVAAAAAGAGLTVVLLLRKKR